LGKDFSENRPRRNVRNRNWWNEILLNLIRENLGILEVERFFGDFVLGEGFFLA